MMELKEEEQQQQQQVNHQEQRLESVYEEITIVESSDEELIIVDDDDGEEVFEEVVTTDEDDDEAGYLTSDSSVWVDDPSKPVIINPSDKPSVSSSSSLLNHQGENLSRNSGLTKTSHRESSSRSAYSMYLQPQEFVSGLDSSNSGGWMNFNVDEEEDGRPVDPREKFTNLAQNNKTLDSIENDPSGNDGNGDDDESDADLLEDNRSYEVASPEDKRKESATANGGIEPQHIKASPLASVGEMETFSENFFQSPFQSNQQQKEETQPSSSSAAAVAAAKEEKSKRVSKKASRDRKRGDHLKSPKTPKTPKTPKSSKSSSSKSKKKRIDRDMLPPFSDLDETQPGGDSNSHKSPRKSKNKSSTIKGRERNRSPSSKTKTKSKIDPPGDSPITGDHRKVPMEKSKKSKDPLTNQDYYETIGDVKKSPKPKKRTKSRRSKFKKQDPPEDSADLYGNTTSIRPSVAQPASLHAVLNQSNGSYLGPPSVTSGLLPPSVGSDDYQVQSQQAGDDAPTAKSPGKLRKMFGRSRSLRDLKTPNGEDNDQGNVMKSPSSLASPRRGSLLKKMGSLRDLLSSQNYQGIGDEEFSIDDSSGLASA